MEFYFGVSSPDFTLPIVRGPVKPIDRATSRLLHAAVLNHSTPDKLPETTAAGILTKLISP